LLQNVRNMLNEDCPQLFKEPYPVFFVFDIDDATGNSCPPASVAVAVRRMP